MTHYLLLILSLVIVLAGSALFTNGLEWFGKKLDYSDRAIGGVFAAVGTAMPETLVPIIAILFGSKEAGPPIGMGTIIGAPLMLTTLAMFFSGVSLWWNRKKRPDFPRLNVEVGTMRRDFESFFVFYGLAIAATFIDGHVVKMFISALLILFYVLYAVYALRSEQTEGANGDVLEACYFSPKSANPAMPVVLAQIVVSLGMIVLGADLLVHEMQIVSANLGVSPFLLSLFIIPIATELPEKFNSVIWISKGKDSLAMGNITGSLVWQSSVIVAVGILFTDWKLDGVGYFAVFFTFVSAGLIYAELRGKKRLTCNTLLAVGAFYLFFAALMELLDAR